MLKRIAILSALLVGALALWLAGQRYGIDYFYKGFLTLVAIAAIFFIFKFVIEGPVIHGIGDERSRYTFSRIMSVLYYAGILLAIAAIWIPGTRALLVSYGIVGAGVAVSLQDVFRNLAGSIIIFMTRAYRVGDRIEVSSKYGDVIDIGIMYTTMLEIREWVEGDQPTGRIIIMPNSHAINTPINNYTKQLSFIFEDVSIPITYKSNWRKAADGMLEIAKNETTGVTEAAKEQMHSLSRTYFVQNEAVEPGVYMTITDNWVELNLRYPTLAVKRRTTKDRISRAILEMVEASDDIEIASATFDIVGFPDVRVKNV